MFVFIAKRNNVLIGAMNSKKDADAFKKILAVNLPDVDYKMEIVKAYCYYEVGAWSQSPFDENAVALLSSLKDKYKKEKMKRTLEEKKAEIAKMRERAAIERAKLKEEEQKLKDFIKKQ